MDVPAVCGLRNQGNTCFMNAVIQCLSNTESFSEYLVGEFYKIDRKKHCKINSRHRASKGEVTEQLANLLKCLWSRRPNSEAAYRFKQVVSRHGPQFGDSAQHDAQEFLLWLLDAMHEDLNLSCRKHNRKGIAVSGAKIMTLNSSNSSLADHLRYNNSFVHDLFQSQVRSSLSCSCGRQSTTVDPLLCFSIPIPSCALSTILVRVSLFRRHHQNKEIRVSVDMRATIRELRDRISRQLRIPEKRLVLLTADHETGAITELTDDSLPIQDTLCDDQVVHAVETSPSKTNETDINVVVVNRDSETRKFGPFFQCCLSRSSSFRKIQLELLQSLTSYLNPSLDVASLSPADFCVLVLVDGKQCFRLSPDVEHPLLMPNVDKALSLSEEKRYRGPVHLNLLIDWDSQVKQTVFSDADFSSQYSTRANPEDKCGVSIYDCLDLYFREERLQPENAWLCPSCQKRSASTLKFSLWSLPDVLLIHLKRFTSSTMRSKLSTTVSFPLTGLDMRSYMDDHNEGQNGLDQSAMSRWGNRLSTARVRSRSAGRDSHSLPSRWAQPWKRPDLRYQQCEYDSRCSTYDLVAVCNHSGNLTSGHYTAICRNPINLLWYNYDDTSVSPVKESEVICSDAYLLFYQRSGLSPTNSCDSAYLSSASHDSRQHDRPNRWSSFRDPDQSRNFLPVNQTDSRCSRSREDVRGSFLYATIPPAKTTRSIYKLLFRKKDRGDVSIIRDRHVTPEYRVKSEVRTSGLTVMLPPEERPGSQKSHSESNPESDGKKTKDDRLLWTVTSV